MKLKGELRVFLVIFAVFMIILVLNQIDQANLGFLGDPTSITSNMIGVAPYVMLIFMGFYYVLKRG